MRSLKFARICTLCLALALMLSACGSGGHGPDFVAPARESPGLYPGTASLPADYPVYEEPVHSVNSQGTPSGQNRLAVSGPDSLSIPGWSFEAEGPIETRPLRSPDGELYILAGSQMLVCDLSGSELRRFSAVAAGYGNERLRWIEGQGPAYIAADRKLYCYAPSGEPLWSYGQGRIGDEWEFGGRLLVEDQLEEAGSRLVSLNSDGSEQWAVTCSSGLQDLQECADGGLLLLGQGQSDALQRLNEDGALRWSAAALLGPRQLKQLSDGSLEVDEQAELLGGPLDTLGWVTIRETYSAAGEPLSRVLLHDDNLYGPTGATAHTPEGVVVTGLPTNAPLLSSLPEYLDSFLQPSLDYTWDDYRLSVDSSGGAISLLKAGQTRWTISAASQELTSPLFDAAGRAYINAGQLGLQADLQTRKLERQGSPALAQQNIRGSALGPDGSRYLWNSGIVFRLDADGAMLGQWRLPAGFSGLAQLICGPDGTIYCLSPAQFGTFNNGTAVFALSPALEEYWHYVDEFDIRKQISLAQDGSLLLFSEDYREQPMVAMSLGAERRGAYEVEQPPYGWQAGSLKCLNRDGSLRWSLALGGPPAGTPLCGDGGRIYWVDGGSSGGIPGLDGDVAIGQRVLRCASLSGNLQWQQPLDSPCDGLRAQLAAGELVLQLRDSSADWRYPPLWLAAHDPNTGAELWRFRRDDCGFESCVADSGGRLYVATQAYEQVDPLFMLNSDGTLLASVDLHGTPVPGTRITLSPDGDICLTRGLSLWVSYR